ncbi:hypothetical protein [Microlunatus sp. Y2014]|uniref:hypothetical protein n=1 Tax=Microlunatus sp. Y2014 TaxID=3418488 RepID=UPI003DA74666
MTRDQAATLVAAWATAVTDRDAAAHDRIWADGTGIAPDALRDNLFALPLAEFAATPAPEDLHPGGIDVDVTWRLDHESVAARHRLRLATTAGTAAEPKLATLRTPPGEVDLLTPQWYEERLTVERSDHVVVLAGRDQAPTRWHAVLEPALAVAGMRVGRDVGTVTVQAPATEAVLAQLIGAELGPDATWAALCRPVGRGSPAPVRLLLHPVRAGAMTDPERAALMRHEAVHLLTDSPRSSLPLWVEEGYAEAVTWADDDAGGWRQAEPLLAELAAGGQPAWPPTDGEFGGAAAARAYALAWSGCRWLLEVAGWPELRRWYDLQAPVDGTAGIDEIAALQQVYGITDAQRRERWAAWLGERT